MKGNVGVARLLYRLLAMFGGESVPPIEAWPVLRVEPFGYIGQDVARVIMRQLLKAIWKLSQEHCGSDRGRPLSWKDRQLGKQEKPRPAANMDHCALAEVLFFALCGLPGGPTGELARYHKMIRMVEGYEPFGVLKKDRNHGEHHMLEEEGVAEECGILVTKETAEEHRLMKQKRPRWPWK